MLKNLQEEPVGRMVIAAKETKNLKERIPHVCSIFTDYCVKTELVERITNKYSEICQVESCPF